MTKTLYIIVGATASGKTSLAIELAKHFHCEIVSADSRQIFKEMNIGVARPTLEELKAVRHHLIATWSINEEYNVARYEKQAINIIDTLFQQNDYSVLVGGSGLYINAVINGIDDMPDISKEVRSQVQQLYEEKGLVYLQNLLKEKDIEYYNIVDKQNHRRIQRALEIYLQTGRTFTSFRTSNMAQRGFKIKIIGISRERQDLINRINQRTDLMIKDGLVEEARELFDYRHLVALNTVGYKELFDYFQNTISLNEAIELIKVHTRQYAKRQMTWFNKVPNIKWIDTTNEINFDEL